MERNNLELACNSLFIEKIKNAFKAAEVDLLAEVYFFSKQRTPGLDSISLQAAILLIHQDADAITVTGVLLIHLLRQGRVEPDEIHRHVGQKITTTISELNVSFVLRINTEQLRRMDIRAPLKSLDGLPSKVILLVTLRLIELESAFEPHKTDVRQMAQETFDFYVSIANPSGLGELRQRLEDVCFYKVRQKTPFQGKFP
jgi:(p)ppGpp synthase/HD superfamily hydrolase